MNEDVNTLFCFKSVPLTEAPTVDCGVFLFLDFVRNKNKINSKILFYWPLNILIVYTVNQSYMYALFILFFVVESRYILFTRLTRILPSFIVLQKIQRGILKIGQHFFSGNLLNFFNQTDNPDFYIFVNLHCITKKELSFCHKLWFFYLCNLTV